MQDEMADAERLQEDMDDLALAAERRKETPIPWEEAKKKLALKEHESCRGAKTEKR